MLKKVCSALSSTKIGLVVVGLASLAVCFLAGCFGRYLACMAESAKLPVAKTVNSWEVNLPKWTHLASLDLSQKPENLAEDSKRERSWRQLNAGEDVDVAKFCFSWQFLQEMNDKNQEKGFNCREFTSSVGIFREITSVAYYTSDKKNCIWPELLQLPSGKYVASYGEPFEIQQIVELDGKVFVVCLRYIFEWDANGKDLAKVAFAMDDSDWYGPCIYLGWTENKMLGNGFCISRANMPPIDESFIGLVWYKDGKWKHCEYQGRQSRFVPSRVTYQQAFGKIFLIRLCSALPSEKDPGVLFEPEECRFLECNPERGLEWLSHDALQGNFLEINRLVIKKSRQEAEKRAEAN